MRGVLVIEIASTLYGAVLAFAAPERLIGLLAAVELDAVGRAVVAQIGAVWAVLIVLLAGVLTLRVGDERGLRVALTAVLVGDVLHVAAVLVLVDVVGGLTAGAAGQLAFITLLVVNRAAAVARPSLVLRGPEG